MKPRARLRVLLGAALALPIGAALAVWAVSRDEAPPDISDLPEIRPAVGDSENAFPGILAVAQTLAERAKSDDALAASLASSTPARERTPEELAHLRSATADLLAPWREAVARPRSLAPAYRDADRPPFEIGSLHKLGRLAALWCAPSDDTDGRMDPTRFAEALRAARLVTESHDTLIVYLTGLASTNLVLAELADHVSTTPPDPQTAKALITALESARLGPEALVSVLHNEAHFTLLNANSDDLEKYVEGMSVVGIPDPPPGAIWFYKPHQSARWEIENLRAGLARIDTTPVSALDWPKPDRGPATLLFGLPHPDNAFGRHYAANTFVDLSSVLRFRPLMNARLSALQAFVALQAERAARGGTPPESLAELVPAYFPAVPVDAADGAPIRYSRERAVVWSVGATGHEPADEAAALPAIEYRLAPPPAAD